MHGNKENVPAGAAAASNKRGDSEFPPGRGAKRGLKVVTQHAWEPELSFGCSPSVSVCPVGSDIHD